MKDPKDIFATSDKDLVLMAVVFETNEHTRSLARAEQVRRQTKAIQEFNRGSSFLAWVMIAAAFIQVVVAVLK